MGTMDWLAPDQPAAPQAGPQAEPWRVLIVDDEEEVHAVTRLVLDGFTLDGRPLTLLSARSAREARPLIEAEPDLALVLLDVVMETDDAGLRLVSWIREDLGNRLVRIVLRTGQPGSAPEKEIIRRYEINDYKAKTELTDTKFFTVLTVALRGYRDLKAIHRSRDALQQIVQGSLHLLDQPSLARFFQGALTQLTALFHWGACGLALGLEKGGWTLLAGTGRFDCPEGTPLADLADAGLQSRVEACRGLKRDGFDGPWFTVYLAPGPGPEAVLAVQADQPIPEEDQQYLRLFASQVVQVYQSLRNQMTGRQHQAQIFKDLKALRDDRERRGVYTPELVDRLAASLEAWAAEGK